MERYCPNEDCGADLTSIAAKPENYESLPQKWFVGVMCPGCFRLVMPTARPQSEI
jgi:hypothetical protein